MWFIPLCLTTHIHRKNTRRGYTGSGTVQNGIRQRPPLPGSQLRRTECMHIALSIQSPTCHLSRIPVSERQHSQYLQSLSHRQITAWRPFWISGKIWTPGVHGHSRPLPRPHFDVEEAPETLHQSHWCPAYPLEFPPKIRHPLASLNVVDVASFARATLARKVDLCHPC